MDLILLYAAIAVIVAAATGLLQVLIWLIVAAIQLFVWAFWAVAGLVSVAIISLRDPRRLRQMWRDADPRRQSFG